jgi:hypothetical protein
MKNTIEMCCECLGALNGNGHCDDCVVEFSKDKDAQLAQLQQELAAMREERNAVLDQARAWEEKWHGKIMCAFCGQIIPLDELPKHTTVCDKHPLRAIEKEVVVLEASLAKAVDAFEDARLRCRDANAVESCLNCSVHHLCAVHNYLTTSCDDNTSAALAEHKALIAVAEAADFFEVPSDDDDEQVFVDVADLRELRAALDALDAVDAVRGEG